MMRLIESDTESDMPYLIGPPGIQQLLDTHASGLGGGDCGENSDLRGE